LEIPFKLIEGLGKDILYMDKKLCYQLGVYKGIHEGIVSANQI